MDGGGGLRTLCWVLVEGLMGRARVNKPFETQPTNRSAKPPCRWTAASSPRAATTAASGCGTGRRPRRALLLPPLQLQPPPRQAPTVRRCLGARACGAPAGIEARAGARMAAVAGRRARRRPRRRAALSGAAARAAASTAAGGARGSRRGCPRPRGGSGRGESREAVRVAAQRQQQRRQVAVEEVEEQPLKQQQQQQQQRVAVAVVGRRSRDRPAQQREEEGQGSSTNSSGGGSGGQVTKEDTASRKRWTRAIDGIVMLLGS